MASNRQLVFDILANNKASGAINAVGDDLDRQQKKWDAWKTAGVVAAGAILVGLGKFGADSVAAYGESEQAQAGLALAFEQFPALADSNIASLQAINAELARKTGFDDDSTAAAQASLAQFGLTGEQIAELTPLMADYAAKTGVDLVTAAEQLGKSMLGQGRSLRAVGIDYQDAGSVAGNFDQVMAGLNTQVAGYAETMGGTAVGQTSIFKDQIGELQEMVGAKLLPALTGATTAGITAVTWMSDHQGVTIGLGSAIGILAAGIIGASVATKVHAAATTLSTGAQLAWNTVKGFGTSTLATWLGVKALEFAAWVRGSAAAVASTAGLVAHGVAMGVVRVATLAWTAGQWLLNAALTANPIGLIIAAIALLIAGIVWAWNNVDWFREGLTAAWEWISTATGNLVSSVGGFFSDLWVDIQNVFAQIWGFMQTVFSWTPLGLIVNNWDAIMAFLGGLPAAVGSALSGLWDGVSSGFKSSLNAIIRAWNGFSLTIGGGEVLGVQIPSVTFDTPNIPLLARGAVVTDATLAVVGEAGKEAILPYDRVDEFAAMVAGNLNQTGPTGNTSSGYSRLHPDDIDALADAILAGAQVVSSRTTSAAQSARVSAVARGARR